MALPLTAAASGTVASISSCPGIERFLRLVSVSDWLRNGHAQDDDALVAAARTASAFSCAENEPSGTMLAGALGGFRRAVRVARADRDRYAGAGEPQREAEAERPGGADDCDGIGAGRCHGGRV